MAEQVDKENEELKSKREQLEARGDAEIEIQFHFKLIFGFDKGRLYWKASKQEVTINSFTTIPGFNLELLAVKPTYRKDEVDPNNVMDSKEIDIPTEGKYLLKNVNESLSTILNNRRTRLYAVLLSGIEGSLNADQQMQNKQYKRDSYLGDTADEGVDSVLGESRIFNRFIELVREKKEDNFTYLEDESLTKYLPYLHTFSALNESRSPVAGFYFKEGNDIFYACGSYDEGGQTYGKVLQLLTENGSNVTFMIKKIKNKKEGDIDTTSSDAVRKEFIDEIFKYYVSGAAEDKPCIFGKLDVRFITDEDRKDLKNGVINRGSDFYKEIDGEIKIFQSHAIDAYDSIVEVEAGETFNKLNATTKDTSKEGDSAENYWETDNIYDGSGTNYPLIERIKKKSYIEVVTDNVKIRAVIKAAEMFEINDSKISGKSEPILFRLPGSKLGQQMREKIEAGETRININYVEFRPKNAAAFLSYVMPDILFVTRRIPDNTLGKIRGFLGRGVKPKTPSTHAKMRDRATVSKIKGK